MDLHSIFIKSIVYPLIQIKNKSSILTYLSEYEKSQLLSRLEIENNQWIKIKKLLEYAYNNCPFYTERFSKMGITPSDIKSPHDYYSFPVITKDDIQLNSLRILPSKISKNGLIEDYTGGSTGKTLKFYYDKQRSERREASRIRHNRWAGWDIGKKMAVLWGDSHDIAGRNIISKIKREFVNRVLFLDAFNMNENKMEEFADELEKFKPHVILAYTNAIYLFARFLQDNGRRIYPKGIICSAETLTQEKREVIESVFRCKVYNRYGSREIGLLASECEKHEGMHINAENVYIEIIKGDKPAQDGEMGEVIVTDLYNYAMPFIRYKIGDVAIATSEICNCGRGLPLIQGVEGRVSDFIVTRDGKIIHGEYFTHLFYGEEGVQQFQLIQESVNNIIINLVPTQKYSEQRIENIKKQIHDYLGCDVQIETRKVQEIPKTFSGKYRFTISKVLSPF